MEPRRLGFPAAGQRQLVLTTGAQDLIRAESESELDTFVLGFALAHLIVERHGLIGRRPAGGSAATSAPAEVPAETATLSDRGVPEVEAFRHLLDDLTEELCHGRHV